MEHDAYIRYRDTKLPGYSLDFSRIVDREQKDLSVYDAKLEYIKTGILHNMKFNPSFVCNISKDPTMFLYFMSELKILPRWYQDMVLSDRHPYRIFVGANQVAGKSFTLQCNVTHKFLHDWGYEHLSLIVSATKEQAKEQLRAIKNMLVTSKVRWEDQKEEDNVFSMRRQIKDDKGNLKYFNSVIAAPWSVGVLGYTVHDLNLDEFDFWDTDTLYAYNQHLEPRTYETMKLGRGQISIYSNPNGYDSSMHKLSNLVMKDGTRKWHTYSFNYWDSPNSNQEDFDMKCVGKTQREIESTLLGVFSTGERSYFNKSEIDDSYDDKLNSEQHIAGVGKSVFGFLDIGSTHDQSVFTMAYNEVNKDKPDLVDVYIFLVHKYPQGYPISRVVGSPSELHENDGWHYEKSVKEYLEEFTVKEKGIYPTFGCDVTGNAGISPLFQAININPVDTVFSGQQKSSYYQRFKTLMEQRRVHRIKDTDWESQARWLVAIKSTRGYLQVHNINHFQKKGKFKEVKTKEDLDDCMDSSAGVIYLCCPFDEIEPSLKIF